MADADEDVVVRPGAAVDEDIDLSDETQDFRFLSAIGADGGKIPKRGEKDFEPHATVLQSDTLAASRQAMHNAISVERLHHPKGYTFATYHPGTNMAYTINPKGVWVPKMGQVLPPGKDPLGNDELRGQRVWLQPEEALYLLERGSLDVRWPPAAGSDTDGLPMSLQAAYAMLIGSDDSCGGALTFERYSVYSALRRGGYTVLRAPSWNADQISIDRECLPPFQSRTWQIGLSHALSWFTAGSPRTDEAQCDEESLIPDGLYHQYTDIYKRLALITAHDPTIRSTMSDMLSKTDGHFRVAYHVYKPSNTRFKKTAPGPPDFRIAVVDARKTNVPTLDQLNALMESVPYQPPPDTPHFYAKLKHGYKNVILAVVDQGITSYLRLADSAFCKEKLYERAQKGQGSKRGGHRGGRGRGR